MRKTYLFLIIIFGFLLGLGFRWWSEEKPTRVERIAQIITEICIPRHKGAPYPSPKELGLASVPKSVQNGWVDPVSKSFLKLESYSCNVATYSPNGLSEADGTVLIEKVSELVAENFSDLKLDPKAKPGPQNLLAAWAQGPVASDDRWGVHIYVWVEDSASFGSSFSIIRPRSAPGLSPNR